MSLLLVAHGTRKPEGVTMVGDLAARVSEVLDRHIHVAFVDVLGPTPQEVLSTLPSDRPVTVVPAFLACGYHVRVDLPAHVTASDHPAVTVTAALGPCPSTVRVWHSAWSNVAGALATRWSWPPPARRTRMPNPIFAAPPP